MHAPNEEISREQAELALGLCGDHQYALGKVIDGKYRLDRLIGSGGMGKVLKATCLSTNEPRAVKILHPYLMSDQDTVDRFHQEARIPGIIDHPNVCPVTDVGEIEDISIYLVMPYLSGCTLRTLAQKEQLTQRRMFNIVCLILNALEAAHRVGVIHRDLKPDNIFISKTSTGEDSVKLLDFGVSKLTCDRAALPMTRTGTFLGTPTFMAPEQARGDKSCDHRVDLYAIGVLLYQLFTGMMPFEGDSYNEIVYKILNFSYAPPAAHNPEISAELEQLIVKAMHKDPNERFAKAAEIHERLQCLDSESRETFSRQNLISHRPTTVDVVSAF